MIKKSLPKRQKQTKTGEEPRDQILPCRRREAFIDKANAQNVNGLLESGKMSNIVTIINLCRLTALEPNIE